MALANGLQVALQRLQKVAWGGGGGHHHLSQRFITGWNSDFVGLLLAVVERADEIISWSYSTNRVSGTEDDGSEYTSTYIVSVSVGGVKVELWMLVEQMP
jgi:hypothetical protein